MIAVAHLAGTNVAGDSILNRVTAEDTSSGGASPEVAALQLTYGCTSRTVLCYALDILSNFGTAGVTNAGINIRSQGGNPAISTISTDPSTLGELTATTYSTATNCSSAASPAACGSAAAGSVVVAAAATTVVVDSTAVTANSQIFLMFDSSLGTKLSVTCNGTEPALYGVTARTANTSFTITATMPSVNPACFSYFIVN